MMISSVKLLLMVVSSHAADTWDEDDKDLEDILGQTVGEMSYADVKDLVGSRLNISSNDTEGNLM